MKAIFTSILVIALILVSCAPAQTTPGSIQQLGSQPTAKTTTTLDDLIPQVKADTISKSDGVSDMQIPVNIKSGHVGDYVVIGLDLNKGNKAPGTLYFGQISYIEGRDSNSNMIESDKTVMNSWATPGRTETFAFSDTDKLKFIPLIMKIGPEVSSGVATTPGTYQFEVQMYQDLGNGLVHKIDGMVKTFYVKVQ